MLFCSSSFTLSFCLGAFLAQRSFARRTFHTACGDFASPLQALVTRTLSGACCLFTFTLASFPAVAGCLAPFLTMCSSGSRFVPNSLFADPHLFKPAEYFIEQGNTVRFMLGFLLAYRRGLRRCDASYCGLLPHRLGFLPARRQGDLLGRFFHKLVTCLNFAKFYIVMTQPCNAVIGRFKMDVGDQNNTYFQTCFDSMNFRAFFIQQVSRYIYRHLSVQHRCILLHCFFLNDSENVQR